MVKEPVEFISNTEENRKKRMALTSSSNEPLFYIVDVTGQYKQLVLKYRETAIWHITTGYDWDSHYTYNNNSIDRESFIITIKDVFQNTLNGSSFIQSGCRD